MKLQVKETSDSQKMSIYAAAVMKKAIQYRRISSAKNDTWLILNLDEPRILDFECYEYRLAKKSVAWDLSDFLNHADCWYMLSINSEASSRIISIQFAEKKIYFGCGGVITVPCDEIFYSASAKGEYKPCTKEIEL